MFNLDEAIGPIASAKSRAEVMAALAVYASGKGGMSFTYEITTSPPDFPEPFYETTFPKSWTDLYVERRYARRDIMVSHGANALKPFTWTEARERAQLTASQASLFQEANQFGIHSGALAPIHGPGSVKGYVAIVSELGEREFNVLFESFRDELHLVTMYAHERILAFERQRSSSGLLLSPREIEVLTWAAVGCSVPETAEMLSISDHTAKAHLDNAKEKLFASNKTHAVAIAMSRGLIRL